jgi:hypothetical protein
VCEPLYLCIVRSADLKSVWQLGEKSALECVERFHRKFCTATLVSAILSNGKTRKSCLDGTISNIAYGRSSFCLLFNFFLSFRRVFDSNSLHRNLTFFRSTTTTTTTCGSLCMRARDMQLCQFVLSAMYRQERQRTDRARDHSSILRRHGSLFWQRLRAGYRLQFRTSKKNRFETSSDFEW